MNKQKVTITDMMKCREKRVQIQNEFIARYHDPVISFCMNIPGPIKTSPLIRNGFEAGKDEITDILTHLGKVKLLDYNVTEKYLNCWVVCDDKVCRMFKLFDYTQGVVEV